MDLEWETDHQRLIKHIRENKETFRMLGMIDEEKEKQFEEEQLILKEMVDEIKGFGRVMMDKDLLSKTVIGIRYVDNLNGTVTLRKSDFEWLTNCFKNVNSSNGVHVTPTQRPFPGPPGKQPKR